MSLIGRMVPDEVPSPKPSKQNKMKAVYLFLTPKIFLFKSSLFSQAAFDRAAESVY